MNGIILEVHLFFGRIIVDDVSIVSLRFYVSDLERSRAFYETLGFKLAKQYNGWTVPTYYIGELGSVSFEIWPLKEGKTSNPSDAIGLRVGNVPEILVRLSEMNEKIDSPVGPLVVKFKWASIRYAQVQDPDGRKIRLYEARTEAETDQQAVEIMESIGGYQTGRKPR